MVDKKTDAWMPLWIGAYLADTMSLTTVQHGAYFLMLMAYWREQKALPDSNEELRSITKTDKSEWKKMRPTLEKFFRIGDGVWWHKRVEAEMAASRERSSKAAAKAKAGADARWGKTPKHSFNDATSNAPSMLQELPEDMHDECPTSHTITIGIPTTVAKEVNELNTHNAVCVSEPGIVCKAMRVLGIPDVNPGHAELLMLIDAGAGMREFEGAARAAVAKSKGFSYALGIVKKSRQDAATDAATVHQGAMPSIPKTSGKFAGAAIAIWGEQQTKTVETFDA